MKVQRQCVDEQRIRKQGVSILSCRLLIVGESNGLHFLPLPRAVGRSVWREVEIEVQHVRGTVGRWVSEEKTLASSDEQVVRNRVVIDVVIERQFAVPVA